ncbi:MAG: hypothetical protein R3F31_07615 [Verrucomicrobiales bacterium]
MRSANTRAAAPPRKSAEEFKKLVEEKIHIDDKKKHYLSLVQREGSLKTYVQGWYESEEAEKKGDDRYVSFQTEVNLEYAGQELRDLLAKSGYEIQEMPVADGTTAAMLLNFWMPIIVLVVLMWLLFRHQIRMAGRGAMSFGKSKAKLMQQETNRITFKDVAGVEEAKEEVWEIVEFLRDPKNSNALVAAFRKACCLWASGNRENAARPCHCRGSGSAVLFHQRLRLCRNVRRSRRQPGARHV